MATLSNAGPPSTRTHSSRGLWETACEYYLVQLPHTVGLISGKLYQYLYRSPKAVDRLTSRVLTEVIKCFLGQQYHQRACDMRYANEQESAVLHVEQRASPRHW